ncbi:MAG: DUF402 domain-containing protein [Dehalococcoidia bacterium]|nr:DUF402 domain-containing protein [Dehalococcoidia bacterium]
MEVIEIKRRLDGREERFPCLALGLTDRVAVLRFNIPPEANFVVQKTVIPSGSTTIAVFWQGANYLVYKMMDARGALLGYRLDVCKDVDITTNTVNWTDLVLDAWVAASDAILFLDEDEVDELTAGGLILGEDRRIIEMTKEFLLSNYLQVISDAEKEIKSAGVKEGQS